MTHSRLANLLAAGFDRGGRGGDEGLARTRGGYVAETRRGRGKNEFRPGAWHLGLFLETERLKSLLSGATRFLYRGNDIRQALARVFAPVGATTNLGRAANRAGAI